MNIQDNDIDKIFRMESEKVTLDFNKDEAWAKLLKMKKLKLVLRVSLALAAVFILGLILFSPFYENSNTLKITDEYQKRQKLKEYESKLSGTYEELLLCEDCNGEIMKSQIKQKTNDNSKFGIY